MLRLVYHYGPSPVKNVQNVTSRSIKFKYKSFSTTLGPLKSLQYNTQVLMNSELVKRATFYLGIHITEFSYSSRWPGNTYNMFTIE